MCAGGVDQCRTQTVARYPVISQVVSHTSWWWVFFSWGWGGGGSLLTHSPRFLSCGLPAQERERAELAERLKKRKAERLQLEHTLSELSEAVKVNETSLLLLSLFLSFSLPPPPPPLSLFSLFSFMSTKVWNLSFIKAAIWHQIHVAHTVAHSHCMLMFCRHKSSNGAPLTTRTRRCTHLWTTSTTSYVFSRHSAFSCLLLVNFLLYLVSQRQASTCFANPLCSIKVFFSPLGLFLPSFFYIVLCRGLTKNFFYFYFHTVDLYIHLIFNLFVKSCFALANHNK